MDYFNDKSNGHTGCVCFKIINGCNIGEYVNTVHVGPILWLELLMFFARHPFKPSMKAENIVLVGTVQYRCRDFILKYKY